MKLKDKIKPAIPPLPIGTYQAICIGVVDLGDQYDKMYEKTKRTINLVFEIPSETAVIDGKPQPRRLRKFCSCSIRPNSNLFALLNS